MCNSTAPRPEEAPEQVRPDAKSVEQQLQSAKEALHKLWLLHPEDVTRVVQQDNLDIHVLQKLQQQHLQEVQELKQQHWDREDQLKKQHLKETAAIRNAQSVASSQVDMERALASSLQQSLTKTAQASNIMTKDIHNLKTRVKTLEAKLAIAHGELLKYQKDHGTEVQRILRQLEADGSSKDLKGTSDAEALLLRLGFMSQNTPSGSGPSPGTVNPRFSWRQISPQELIRSSMSLDALHERLAKATESDTLGSTTSLARPKAKEGPSSICKSPRTLVTPSRGLMPAISVKY
jgi:hypothetical protein|eukprot:CAMPEP_0174313770 /NCGR_PEP_ID=MMETSP0810-20121108/5208_1 /TAXON_ID=73025 ORGANISM="Eutreptiella gymnastica-like, Strain CCMP1594" /NCGR_SAMPLE_ID=MMETSP0810 /ASSEMBLY_ACC=CAM_ASM_000659 /LENGTH=290 /DNA_ID=CAMNT_0015422667 /DNA_START=41 /DNA_END=913 /DNA_ORIENTATION=-